MKRIQNPVTKHLLYNVKLIFNPSSFKTGLQRTEETKKHKTKLLKYTNEISCSVKCNEVFSAVWESQTSNKVL